METDLIDEQIKQLNKKVTPIALVCAALIGGAAAIFDPFSSKLLIFFVASVISFSILYQLLFYLFGKELVNEAKKRKRYFYKIIDFSEDEPFSFQDIERPKDDPNLHTDSRYSYLSYNIHNKHHYH